MRIARFLSNDAVFTGALVDDRSARLISGDLLGSFSLTDQIVRVDRLLAPIIPTDLLCIGLNYHAHAQETKSEVPDNPMLFIKSGNALSEPNAPIVLPNNSSQIDFEGELVVIIGKACKNVSRERALDYVLGYTIGNDVSARDWQKDKKLNGGQFARGKSFDGFAPIGPWLVTSEEVPSPNDLKLTTVVSGEVMQQASTKEMMFDVASVISSLSQTMTIRAGAAIFTGTPSGVGAARSPQRFLRAGDTVEITIEKLGTLRNTCIAE